MRLFTACSPGGAILLALALAPVLTGLVGCAPATGAAPAVTLPVSWSTAHSARFERLLDEHLPRGESTALSPTALDELRAGLAGAPSVATRAALWLARASHRDASTVLLERLEERHSGPARTDDVGDAVAAMALGRQPLADRTIERLTALAIGPRPHPDIEVRVECAIAALENGEHSVVPLLLRVLRIDTPSAAREGPLTDSPTTAWARGRADRALTTLAGATYRNRTDAPYSEREAWADELEERLSSR